MKNSAKNTWNEFFTKKREKKRKCLGKCFYFLNKATPTNLHWFVQYSATVRFLRWNMDGRYETKVQI